MRRILFQFSSPESILKEWTIADLIDNVSTCVRHGRPSVPHLLNKPDDVECYP
ncbi:hypothetical protein PITCH_A450010 [uncultured Desulfobacterium sp.]|uniref:Uncharacterized protein n=1 Tax=uncultured Desulfobacterium sp. TaxID=201089 RepID=A0A445N0M9_9BACT|nr:hypothetical protein PITCH_A450010 [uncultured Desulfobacterium sp.]